MSTFIWPFLIYWLVMFVACFVVVEVGQDQLYDQVTPRAGLKVASGSLLIALLLTWLRVRGEPVSYESMFTTNFAWTVLQGIVWFGVFTLIFQFHPWHALGLGLITMVLVTGFGDDGCRKRPRQAGPDRGGHPGLRSKPAGSAVALAVRRCRSARCRGKSKVNDGDVESFGRNRLPQKTGPRVLGHGLWPSCGPLLKWTMAGERLDRPAVIVVMKMRLGSTSLMVWGGFLLSTTTERNIS